MIPVTSDLPDGPILVGGGGDTNGPGGGSGGGYYPPGDPSVLIPGVQPGIGAFARRRYTSNVVINEEIPLPDLLDEVLMLGSRMFLSQGANGKIRFHHKKPTDWGYVAAAVLEGDDQIELDDVRPWVASVRGYLLLDPHTTRSEVREVLSAVYPAANNSYDLSSDHADVTATAFSGAAGGSTPATATLTVGAITDGATYTITLDGNDVPFTVTSADTAEGLAAVMAAVMGTHPIIGRRWGYSASGSVVTVTSRLGTLYLSSGAVGDHDFGVTDPTAAATLAASGTGTDLQAGPHSVVYAFANERGETLPSPFATVTVADGNQIDVSGVALPAGATAVRWYVSPSMGSNKLRFYLENNGAGHSITQLPKLTATPPADLNGTVPQVMRIAASFSDRRLARADANRANVLMASYEWSLSDRKKQHNAVYLKYREALDDFRLVELREKDAAHIAKIKKTNKREANGQAIDNYYQAKRIALGLLAEELDGNFNYSWAATRRALLLEQGDVVAITDSGSGVVNLPVMVEEIEFDLARASVPRAKFTGRMYWTELYDDGIREKRVPIAIG